MVACPWTSSKAARNASLVGKRQLTWPKTPPFPRLIYYADDFEGKEGGGIGGVRDSRYSHLCPSKSSFKFLHPASHHRYHSNLRYGAACSYLMLFHDGGGKGYLPTTPHCGIFMYMVYSFEVQFLQKCWSATTVKFITCQFVPRIPFPWFRRSSCTVR